MPKVGRALTAGWRRVAGEPTRAASSDNPSLATPFDPGDDFGDAFSTPASPRGRRHAASRRRLPARIRARLIAAAGLAACLAGTSLTDIPEKVRPLLPDLPSRDEIARAAGLGIDQVSLTGHRFTADGAVFDALDLANARSIVSFDASAVKSRLERLPWIATADITRIYPDRLEVRISEREPAAVWIRGQQHFLIDAGGRVLDGVTPGTRADLPRVSGEGAAEAAKAVGELIQRYPLVAARLIEAERVGERRWTLHLASGVTIKLPADQEAQGLDLLSTAQFAPLIERAECVIDLRAPGRVSVRPAGSAAASACSG